MKLSKLKINPNNPQIYEDLSKLENSIKDFPKMMELRPLVYDPETMQVLGGNKRLICLQNLGFDEISDKWVKSAKELTEEEKQRFIIADNVGFGEWDEDILKENWNIEDLEDWGVILNKIEIPENIESRVISDKDFEENINKINNDNCKLPIVPDFFEKHECFIIPIHNEIDEKFIRNIFGLNENYISNSKDKKVRKTNVISVSKIKEWQTK